MAKTELPELIVDGKVFDPNPPTPALLKIKQYLDKSERRHVKSKGAMIASGFKDNSLRFFAADKRFSKYACREGARQELFYGHPDGIELFKKHVAKALAERAK